MKNIIKLLTIGAIFLLVSSCEKWLDVQPKTEIKSEVIFETEQGFKDALIGCYILMGDQSLYGKEMTFGFMEIIGQQFEFNGSSSSVYYNLASYKYDSYRGRIDNMWLKSYNIIANLNNIIENLEKNKSLLRPTAYSILKGEAYGLRAFLHFDLLRMFSWGNLQQKKDKLNLPAIPYVKEYNKVITKQHSVNEVLSNLEEDINISLELLKQYDPNSFAGARPDDFEEYGANDPFYLNDDRKYHLNYNAALMLKMRILMWKGDPEDENAALGIAESLIDKASIPWISSAVINHSELRKRDLCFVTEQVFGIETFKRFDTDIKLYFKLTVADDLNTNYQCLYHTKTRADKLFEIASDIGVSDYRYTCQYNKVGSKFEIIKFWEYENMAPEYVNNMPLMSKAEIYYTAAECLNKRGGAEDKEKAIRYINLVRNARGIPISKNLENSLTNENVKLEIEKEWQKEFLGGGQMFFFYKRLGYTNIPGSTVPADDKLYLLPLPDSEVEKGRVDHNKKKLNSPS